MDQTTQIMLIIAGTSLLLSLLFYIRGRYLHRKWLKLMSDKPIVIEAYKWFRTLGYSRTESADMAMKFYFKDEQ